MHCNRRSILSCGVSILALAGCRRLAHGGPSGGVSGAIDIHCHVFNASDLSVRGFVQRVLLGDQEEQRFPDVGEEAVGPALAALLVRLLSSGAPTAIEELALLSQEAGTLPVDEAHFEAALTKALSETLEPSGDTGIESGASERDALRAQIINELGIEEGSPPPEMNELAGGLLRSDSFVGRHIRWAALMTSPRETIAAKLNTLYGGPAGTVLFTPALVDMALWLDEEPRSPIASQIEVMEALQRRTADFTMHCLAPFDPWRSARDHAAGRLDYAEWRELGRCKPAELSALGLAQWAIAEMGFVGVKLYPPMGFRPAGNADTVQSYPERAIDEFPSDFPDRLDRELGRLYRWCADAGVPVLAHASNSQGAAAGYSERAYPGNWSDTVDAYPGLRICLAHFGDSLTTAIDGSWDAAAGASMARPGSNVFADLSYHSGAFPAGSDIDLRAQGRVLGRFIELHDPDVRHLVFGTDWSMIGREQGHEQYALRIGTLLDAAELDMDAKRRVLSSNALRFLGLEGGSPALQRLIDYYEKAGLGTEKLRFLDI